MKITNTAMTTTALTAACLAQGALADVPNIFGMPMEHIMLTFEDGEVGAHAGRDASDPVEMRRFDGESYDGASGVLDGTYYSDQYGWLADGFISLAAGEFMWIETTSTSAGLNVYEGGMRPVRATHSYDAILGTDGSSDRWMWGGTMTHNWYSADELGAYEATYEVYVGDENGDAFMQYQSASVTLYFNAVPAPSGLALLTLGAAGAVRRRR